MMPRAWTIARAASLALCAAPAILVAMDVLGMEAAGGSLTGALARLCLGGGMAFLVCVAVVIVRPGRVAAALAVLAAASCLPLHLYLVAPKSLAWLSSAPSSVSLPGGIAVDMPALVGLLSLAIMALVHGLSSARLDPGRRAR